jgi:uncharacterized protein (TIGR03790 family)
MKYVFSLCTLFSFASFSQMVNYHDVGVVINDNSQVSIEIANYFQNARNIPAQNMIHIMAPTTEVIDVSQFQQIRAQIENYLISNSLQDSLNYLVTTKGVPLRINGNDCLQTPGSYCASFDADLALILGPHSGFIENTFYTNPYFGKNENFSRDTFGFYLVTRLDGYSKEDVLNLIDNSGPNTGLDQQNDLAILDLNMAGPDSLYFANIHLQPAYDTLTNSNWNTTLDSYDPPMLNQNNVFAYYTTGFGPINSVDLNYTWTQGSFSSMSTNQTAATFDPTSALTNGFLLADLIAQGCTAAHGHVNPIYFSQIFKFEVFVSRYLDPTKDYNLAESYYMGEPSLSSQTVIVGDPKASVYIANPATLQSIDKDFIRVFPNPTYDQFNVFGIHELSGDVSLSISAIDGSILEIDQDVQEGESYGLTVSGVYFIHVFSDGTLIGTYRITKQ